MKKSLSFLRCLLLIVPILACAANAIAQNLPGKRDTVYSEVLKEERVIQVLLPEKYKAGSADKYDVLYLLDGDWNMKYAADIQLYLQNESYLPPMIVVAVMNTSRERDFTPTPVTGAAGTGGADKFLSFFKRELIPHIEKSYPANGNNILYGHSLGGLFSVYALLTEPQLFNSYLAVDPSLWWDNNYLLKLAGEKLGASSLSGKSLFIGGREGESLQQMGIAGMDAFLKSKAPKDLSWKVAAFPNETHGSIRFKSVYDGLKFFYDGYINRGVVFHPMSGIAVKDKPFTLFYFGLPGPVHFTTDGSEPTASSPRMAPENTVLNPVKISAKVLDRASRYNQATVGEFTIGKALAPHAKPEQARPGGFHYAYYEGEWSELPDFSKLKPVKSGIAGKDFDLAKLPRQTNYGCLMEGDIEIQKDGYYIFVLDSDDGSKFFLDGKLLIANDGLHGAGNPRTFMVPLEKGFYPVRVEYFQNGGGALLKLDYVVPGEEKSRPVPVPLELQYSRQ